MMNRHRHLRGKRGTAINVFTTSREQASTSSRQAGNRWLSATLITANRAGQIANEMSSKWAREDKGKPFVSVQRRSKVIARFHEKNIGIHLAHSITRRCSLPLRRPASDDGSSAVRSGAPLPHMNTSPTAVHLPSQPHPLHMVVCIAETVKLQNSKPLSLTFRARADIMRIRIKSRRPLAASEAIFPPKRTRRASDSKVPFFGFLVLVGLSSL